MLNYNHVYPSVIYLTEFMLGIKPFITNFELFNAELRFVKLQFFALQFVAVSYYFEGMI